MTTTRSRARRAVAAAAAVATVGLGAVASAQDTGATTTYTAPYEAGPISPNSTDFRTSGYSQQTADPATGEVSVARVHVVPAVAGCGNGSPYAKLQVTHDPAAAVSTVTVDYTGAAVDPYTFIRVGVRTASGYWLGTTAVRGPVGGDGSIEVPVDAAPAEMVGEPVVVEFGLEQTGACPSADYGQATFTAVHVTE